MPNEGEVANIFCRIVFHAKTPLKFSIVKLVFLYLGENIEARSVLMREFYFKDYK